MKKALFLSLSAVCAVLLTACGGSKDSAPKAPYSWVDSEAAGRPSIYVPVKLSANLDHLSPNQQEMVALLIDASKIMDDLFWKQSYGNKAEILAQVDDIRGSFVELNYGPWDRLNGDKPFLTSVEEKPLGAQFYPHDMTKEEFEKTNFEDKKGLYSIVARDANGKLEAIPYSKYYREPLTRASELLKKAAALAENQEFKNYLLLRADAFLTDDYQPSDFAWMDMKNNPIEVVIGPIETYEDQLFGYRTAFESYVLIKDLAWSKRLSKFAAFLPDLQKGLPVDDAYKAEVPGTDSDLNAYDVIFYAGHSNAGSKTIAINLPNDEEVQLKKGTRRLQLKNAMRAKFDNILVPIADELIVPEQRKHITFDAFFANTMFHEVAHGLGIKNTITDKGTVRESLKELASALEEGKADILGLYMVSELFKRGEIKQGTIEDNLVTFMAGIFRSVRFGASSAHGRANMIRFNYFQKMGAFERTEKGLYRVDFNKFKLAMNSLSRELLMIQGDGDYERGLRLLTDQGVIKAQLQSDLDRLETASIPVDINFIQGKKVLGLK
jgi:hypothetical protein